MEITKELLVQYYIKENHTLAECCEHFELTKKNLCKIINEFNCHKPKSLWTKNTPKRSHESYIAGGKKSSETQKRNWDQRSKEEKIIWSEKCKNAQLNMDSITRAKHTEDMLNTYFNKSEEERKEISRKKSIANKQYWQELNPEIKQEKINNKLEKTRQTCLDRYNVEYNCMRKEARMHGNDSRPNRDFASLLDANGFEFSESVSENIKTYSTEFNILNKSYDFKIGNNLVEINPTITHNATFSPFGREPLDKNYHYNKSKLARENNYRCICIWDWDDKNKIIQLLKSRERIYARNCEIKSVSQKDAADFINKYHLQNYAKDTIRIGLYNNSELVSIMTFGKPRYNKKYDFELIRYCSSKMIIGGAEKLFKYFIDNYNPNSVISYCDLSKFNGNTYLKLGFTLDKINIGKHWYNISTGKHITDNLLRQHGFDRLFNTNYGKGASNSELMLMNGFVEVYDCGQATYILNTKNSIK